MLKWAHSKIRKKCRKIIHSYIKALIYYKFYILKCKSNQKIYYYVWNKLIHSKICLFLFSFVDNNPYQQNYLDYLPYRIASTFSEIDLGISFVPKFLKVPDKEINDILSSNQGAIIISIHDGFSYSTKLISDRCKRISILANHPDKVRKNQFKKTGVIESRVNIIKADKYCLINISKALHQSHIICAHIDFNGKKNQSTSLSPALINFALQKKIPLYFSNYKVMNNGSVNIFIEKSDLSCHTKKILVDFTHFINTTSGYERNFEVQFPNKLN
jgi:hypothetical protein